MLMRRCFAGFAALAMATGCSKSTSETAPEPVQAPAAAARRNPNLITAEELAASNAQNAYQAIQILRPAWLRTRGSGGHAGPQTPVVYVDQNRFGSLQALVDINVTGIAEIRYMDSIEATNRFGTGHGGGAILVTYTRQ